MAFTDADVGHGKNMVFKAGTLSSETDISQYIDSVNVDDDTDEAQAAGTGAWKHFKAGQRGLTATVTGTITKGASDAYLILVGIWGTEEKSFIYGPDGDGAGFPKKSWQGFVKSVKPAADVNGVPKFTATIRCSGTITDSTW